MANVQTGSPLAETQGGSEATHCKRVRYIAPIIPGSKVPALLGFDALRDLGAVIDTRTNNIHLLKATDTLTQGCPGPDRAQPGLF